MASSRCRFHDEQEWHGLQGMSYQVDAGGHFTAIKSITSYKTIVPFYHAISFFHKLWNASSLMIALIFACLPAIKTWSNLWLWWPWSVRFKHWMMLSFTIRRKEIHSKHSKHTLTGFVKLNHVNSDDHCLLFNTFSRYFQSHSMMAVITGVLNRLIKQYAKIQHTVFFYHNAEILYTKILQK